MIPYARQSITQEDIKAVNKVLRSKFLTQGPLIQNFEKSVAKYTKTKYSVAVNSATSGLHIACMALGVKKGDYVWTSVNTFVASANCALYCGAKVDLVDIDPSTYNIDTFNLESKLQKAKKKNKLPKVVIVVHFAGQPCDMEKIFDLSKKYNFKIIEDASHAIGATYNSKKKKTIKIGSCVHSDITIFSFHPVKIITTAEGGMALTNRKDLFNKMKVLRSHGITKEIEKKKTNMRPWLYEQISLGYNYRMNEIQAALGCEQLKRIDNFILRRHVLADRYNKKLSNLPINLPAKIPDTYSSFHLYVISLSENLKKSMRLKIFKKMRKKGIEVNFHYIPVHMHPYYKNLGFKKGDYPVAENYYERAMSIPIFPSLSKENQNYIIECLNKCF